MKNSNWNSLVDQSLCKTEITKRDCTSEIYPFLKEIISPTPSTIYRFVWYKKAPDITTLVVVSLHCVLDLALRSIRAKNEDLKAFLFVEIVWNWLNLLSSCLLISFSLIILSVSQHHFLLFTNDTLAVSIISTAGRETLSSRLYTSSTVLARIPGIWRMYPMMNWEDNIQRIKM